MHICDQPDVERWSPDLWSSGLPDPTCRVVRIDVFKAGIRTDTGAGVGDSEEQIKRRYAGHITVGPHQYNPDGHYLTYSPETSADRGCGIVFETDGTKVTSYRAGTLAAIALVEGCS